MATTDRAQRLNALQHSAIGSFSGMIEVMLQQPTIAMKNAVQQGKPIPWSVPTLYRGVGVSLASIAPICAVQFGVNGKLLTLAAQHGEGGKAALLPPDQLKIACGAMAGVASALLGSPGELVMTLQQNNGRGFGATVREVVGSFGVARLFRGLEVTALRDGVWCASYLALGPVLTEKLHAVNPQVFGSVDSATASQKTSASVVGSILAGLVTVYATQPVDTVKTVMQGEAMSVGKHAPGALAVAKRIYSEGGWQRFYKGSVPRGVRLVGAVFILGQARNQLEALFDEHELLKSVV
uniref:Mitochondrial carrier protein n=1 Tax=Globisporangium ultimum (strain ATCC 200006 / CBS 805.95 / DAOM BR144) TaxID=431595 RepID=K3X4F5_GLOUD